VPAEHARRKISVDRHCRYRRHHNDEKYGRSGSDGEGMERRQQLRDATLDASSSPHAEPPWRKQRKSNQQDNDDDISGGDNDLEDTCTFAQSQEDEGYSQFKLEGHSSHRPNYCGDPAITVRHD